MEKIVDQELKNLYLWLNVNRLALNINKTRFVIFHSPQNFIPKMITLKISRKAISQKDYIKYLGITMDCHLNLKQHILNISKKLVDKGNLITGKVGKDLNIDEAYDAAKRVGISILSVIKFIPK